MQRRRRRWTWRDWRTACGPFWQKVPKKPPRYQHQAQAGSLPPAVPDWAGIDNCVFCQETAAVETAEVCGEKAFSETTQTLLKRYRQTLPKSMRNRRGFDLCCFCAAPDYQAAWLRTCRCLWPLSLCSISLMKRWVPSVTSWLEFSRFGGARGCMCSVPNRIWSWWRWTTCRTSSSDKATEETPGESLSFHLPDAFLRFYFTLLIVFLFSILFFVNV